MENYTAYLENIALETLEGDDLREKLLEAAGSFRTFDVALDEFIQAQGYEGDIQDISAKTEFIKNAFERASVTPVPRDIRKWFTVHKEIERRTAFQICFAFGLNRKETDDFFRRVYLERSFDCHNMEEAVYYFCMKNGLGYPEALRIIGESPAAEVPDIKKSKIEFGNSVLFTSAIIKELDKFSDAEELLLYFRKNVDKFGYNHAKATEIIQRLWNDIFEKDGLADKEKVILQKGQVSKKKGTFTIYRQILGLDDVEEIKVDTEDGKTQIIKKALFVIPAERSIKPILKNNLLLPAVAEKDFPNRLTIDKIMKGGHVEHESIRKVLILLKFYSFWLGKIFKGKTESDFDDNADEENRELLKQKNMMAYSADAGDTQRCILGVDKMLMEAGYPELYYGNPYDWIFLYSSESDEPMTVFREFIRELYLEKEDICQGSEEEQ